MCRPVLCFFAHCGPFFRSFTGLIAVFLALLFGALAHGAPASPSASARTVTIGILNDNEPYSWVNAQGVPQGFSIDVLEEVSRHTGVRFTYRAGNWPEIYSAFMRGELDAIDEISFREDRAQRMLFSQPYHFRHTVIMHNATRPLPYLNTIEDLAAYRVGVVSDIFYAKELQEKGIKLVFYDNLPGLIRALAFGWVDAVIGAEMTLSFLAHKAGFPHLVVSGPLPLKGFEVEDFRVAVQLHDRALLTQIDEGLARIPSTTMAALLEKWQELGGALLIQKPAFVLTESQRDYLRQLGPVRVGIMRDYAPFSFLDAGHLQGLSIDVLRRLQDMTGLEVMPVVDRWSSLLDLLREGRIDLLADMSRAPEREAYTVFTQPYHIIPNVFFVRDPSRRIDSLADLQGLRLGLSAGIFYESRLRHKLGDAQVRSFPNQSVLFEALGQGEVDAVVTALPSGLHWTREHGLSDVRIAGLLELDGMEAGEDLRFGMRPDLAPLRDILDQALSAISHTERRTIENRWLGARFTPLNDAQANNSPRITLTQAEQAYLQQRGHTLTLCVDPNWLPLDALDKHGQHTGLAADVMALLTQRLNLTTHVRRTADWAESLKAARQGQCDMLPMIMQTPQRQADFQFTTPYYVTPTVLLGRIETPFVDALEDFRQKKVAVVRHYAFAELLRLRYPHLVLVEVSDEREGLRRLQNREVDAYMSTLMTTSYYLREMGLADIKVIARVPIDWTLSMASGKDAPLLHAILQKFVDSLTEEERRRIEARWNAIELSESVNYTLAIQIGLGALLLVILMVLWNRKLGSLNRKLAHANDELARLTRIDTLTQIGNRKFFDHEFEAVFAHCAREHVLLVVAMIDIDYFKQINDTHGHRAGDDCLRALARLLNQHARGQTEHVARLGGEEFVVFAPCQKPHTMRQWFEDLRLAAQALRVPSQSESPPLSFSISIGVVMGQPDAQNTPSVFLERADQAMYAAKRAGRNRCLYGGLSGPFHENGFDALP